MVIFVSSIGRSGTRYLANLFDACTDVPSYHALEPHCHGENIAKILNGETPPDLDKKINIIARHIEESGSYFESTQLFNRIFSDKIISEFNDVRLIHLLRDPMEVARSYVNRDSYPGKDDRPWRVPLNNPKSKYRFPLEDLNPFQLNLCDWLENEFQFQELHSRISKTGLLRFRDFGNHGALAKLFEELQIIFNEQKLDLALTDLPMDRNENKITTAISENDIEDAQGLVDLLSKDEIMREAFQDPIYQDFNLLKALVNKPHQLKQV